MKTRTILALTLVLSFVLGGVAMAANVASAPISDGGITPTIIDGENPGGNRTCEEVGLAFFDDSNYYMYSSDRVNYDEGLFDAEFPEGLTVLTDGTYVTWSSTFGIGAVIVKGSDDANVYVYDPQRKSDSGLASPVNASGNPAGLSNLTFCWNPEEQECEWIGETAWAAGNRYVTRGNWATYTPYAGVEKTVTLFAGQTMPAGTVHFSAAVGGQVIITIELNEGWRFADVEENVKIQDYAVTPPAVNPAPGLFDWKFNAADGPFSVPANNFYGVHVEVEWESCE